AVLGGEGPEGVQGGEVRRPDACVACVGGGSNAMGLFHRFVDLPEVKLVGVEAAGEGVSSGRHAATLCAGRVGVLHGSKSYVLQDPDGQVQATHSISAGLDYPGVGPERAGLKARGAPAYPRVDGPDATETLR